MERLNTYIGSTDAALQERPEVFESVGVNLSVNVCARVIDNLMRVIAGEPIVGKKFVGIKRRTGFDVFSHFLLQRALASVRHYVGPYLSAALQEAHNGDLVFSAGASDAATPLVNVHVASLAADEGFVNFDFAAQSPEGFILQGETDAVHHKPCGPLSDSERPAHFVGTNPVFAVGQHPSRSEPLVEADRGILKDGSHLDGELPLGMVTAALPDAAGITETYLGRTTSRADNALRPAPGHKVGKAVVRIREVNYRFLQALRFAHGLVLHELNVP